MRSGVCGCGLQWAVRRSGTSVAYVALSIRCATRDEEGFHGGIAHFVEHTIFKGTSQKTSTQVNNCLDRLGGELDAYTTKEEIVLHATVLKEDLQKAASLLLELATSPTFPSSEIETEKGVVIDEILSYRDSPADDIMDRFEEKLLSPNPLSKRVLGDEDSVRAMTSQELLSFTGKFFTPSRMAFTVVAPIGEEELQKTVLSLVDKFFGGFPSCAPIMKRGKSPLPSASPFREVVDNGNHEGNAVVGGLAPSLACTDERFHMVLLCNMLGGPASNSILNNILREKNGWVYSVEASYVQYEDTGLVAISLGCDKSNVEKCLRTVGRELERLCSKEFSSRRLAWAKRQLLGQQAIGMESGEAQCLSMGKSLLSFGNITSDEEIRSRIGAITSGDLLECARKWLTPDKLSTLIYL